MLVTQTFTDIDQHAAQMSGFEQHYVQLSAGRFHGVFSSAPLPHGMGLDVEWVEQALHQQACVPAETVSIVTFLELEGRCIFNGREIHRLDSLVLPTGTVLDLRTPKRCRIGVISLPEPLLRREMSAWLGPGAPEWSLRAGFLLEGMFGATAWSRALCDVLHAIFETPSTQAVEQKATSLADPLLHAALLALDRPDGTRRQPESLPAEARRDVFRAVSELIHRSDAEALSISMLCRHAGVSRRTLEYCFADAVAMSPLQYLKVRRLNDVRRELAAAASDDVTVGDVAARHGIWHLGRLSKEYSRLFGERPSDTLRARRGRRGD
jgi:AraC family transcriptional regulator, ethanolamine operon transcriptional activator